MFFTDTMSMAEAAEKIEHMQIECRRKLGTGKGHEHEKVGFFRTTWSKSYFPLATEFEHKEVRAVNNELSRDMVTKVYETILRRFQTHHDTDITYDGITADGAEWQFKLINGDQSIGWAPLKTIEERGGFFGIF